ncbi:hypothetical protein IVA79_13915 [Bradyrhizobium sp. 138]|uniref:hypothetical protein n=1 Tax=Bradyrhizobium sp. 138 TaxID=2782615 RepID=UPI001FF94630|nr:hypothetical protein [Bradyrhizobium sp. 138]MCK1735036.1 hypothetical protein [Bradyrhizobium sp. 138]
MGNRTAKFVSALVGSIIAGLPLAAVSQNAPDTSSTANAAADCLASPKGAAPQGQHWYYRVERTTKRQCWYLRAAGAKASQTAQATTDAQDTDSTAPQSLQNARAQYVAPQGVAPGAPNMTAPAPAAASTPPVAQQPAATNNDTAQPAVATRWPDAAMPTASPAPQPQPAPVAAAAPPSAKPAKPAPATPAAADSADKPTGSVQMLLLVIGGALALAGILASLIYRFAGGRGRVQAADRRGHWNDWTPQDHDGSRAPWLGATAADSPRAQLRPVDFDEAPRQATKRVTKLAAIGREIEQIDARKTRAAAPNETRRDEVEIKMFDREFQIEAAAPKLAASESGEDRDHAPADRDREDAVDVDVITTMLEQLAKQGPRLSRPNLEAELANFERSLRGRSAVRA